MDLRNLLRAAAENTQSLAGREFSPVPSPNLAVSADPSDLPPGKYALVVTLLDEKRRVLCAQKEGFEMVEGF